MQQSFHSLEVISVQRPTTSAVTIELRVPKLLQQTFHYYSGQHLIVAVNIDGKEERRSYSLNSSPYLDDHLQITVKRVSGGKVSNYLNDHITVGDQLKVRSPQGNLYIDVTPDDYKSVYLFAAGSGITPIISILKSSLQGSVYNTVYLLYGNSSEDQILFKKELDQLKKYFNRRLHIVYTLSKPGFWTNKHFQKGRIDQKMIESFISDYPPHAQNTEYYACGPGGMNELVQSTLLDLGIPKEMIHFEYFSAPVSSESAIHIEPVQSEFEVQVNGTKHSVTIEKGQTLLDALKKDQIDISYSCESGICGSCIAKINTGDVQMKNRIALDDEMVKQGDILCCQSYPTTSKGSISLPS